MDRSKFLRAGLTAGALRAWAAASGLALVILGPARVRAQQTQHARFTPLFAPLPSEVAVDYARYYTTVEECLATVQRTQAAASPDDVVQVARGCGARFTQIDSAPAADLPLLQKLFLHAEQGNLAWEALGRRLALLPSDSTAPRERLELIRTSVRAALQLGRPAHVVWVEQLVTEVGRLGWAWRLERLAGYHELLEYAARLPPFYLDQAMAGTTAAEADTTQADRYASAILALFDSLPSADYHGQPRWNSVTARAAAQAALWYRRVQALARGEVDPFEPYEVWALRTGAQLSGNPVDSAAVAQAAQTTLAPPLTADVWFNRPDSTTPRPTRGKLSLVVMADELSKYERNDCGLPCQLYARFGPALVQALEITLVTHTHGFFLHPLPQDDAFYRPPPLTAAQEVELIQKYYYERLGLPRTVALAIEVTKFSHLPAPDGRRMDQAPPAVLAYQPPFWMRPDGSGEPRFGKGLVDRFHQRPSSFYLVAPDGKIVKTGLVGEVRSQFPLEAVLAGWLARRAALKS